MQSIDVLPFPERLAFPEPTINKLLPIVGFAVFIGMVLFGISSFKRYAAAQRQLIVVLIACIVIPIGFGILAGSPISPAPQWLLRGLIYIWPLLMILVVVASRYLHLKGYLLGVIIVVNGFALYPYYTSYTRFDEVPIIEQLAALSTADDLLIVDPWYMHPLIRYYDRNHSPLVGYSSRMLWIDVDAINSTDLYGSPVRAAQPPQTNGRIFVYPRKDAVEWAHLFPNTPIFIYDTEARAWRPLAPH